MTTFADWAGYAQATPDAPAEGIENPTFFLDLAQLPAAWWAAVQADGDDIRVTNIEHELLAHDLIEFDSGADTGTLAFQWVGTYNGEPVRVWAGNAAATAPAPEDEFGQYNAYDSNWIAFYPDGGGDDRLENAAHLTMTGSPSVGAAAGPIGNFATEYNGSTQYGSLDGFALDYPVTLISFANCDVDTTERCVVAANYTNGGLVDTTSSTLILSFRGDQGGNPVIAQALDTTGNGDKAAFVNGFDAGQWHHVAGRFTSSTERLCWKDGSHAAQQTQARTINSPLDLVTVGAQRQLTVTHAFFDGKLSMVQIHDIARSDAWIEYQAAMRNQATFWNGWAWTAYAPESSFASEWRMPAGRPHMERLWMDQARFAGVPILNDDVPWFDSSYCQIAASYYIGLTHGIIPVPPNEIDEFIHLDNEWRMPQFPWLRWRPPDEPGYYSDEQEAPHPEVDRIDLPVWVPWRPIPELEYWNQDEELVLPDFYEPGHRFDLPVVPKPQLELLWIGQEDEPLPEIGYDFIPSMDGVPVQPSYFMPEMPPYYNEQVRPDKCPPPCLRRPEKCC